MFCHPARMREGEPMGQPMAAPGKGDLPGCRLALDRENHQWYGLKKKISLGFPLVDVQLREFDYAGMENTKGGAVC